MFGDDLLANAFNMIINVSVTVVILIITLVALVFYALKTNKSKSVALAIGVLMAGAVYEAVVVFPFYRLYLCENTDKFFINLTLYLFLLFLSVVVLHKFVHGGFSHEPLKKTMQIGVFSITTSGLLLTYAYQKLNIENFQDLSYFADVVFGSSYSTLIWSCALIAGLFVIHKLR